MTLLFEILIFILSERGVIVSSSTGTPSIIANVRIEWYYSDLCISDY